MATQPPGANAEYIAVNRTRIESITVFDVKDNELDMLEGGSSVEIHLNLAVAAFTFAVSTVVSLRSGTFEPLDRILFIVLVIMALVLAAYWLWMWGRNRKSNKSICTAIRKRTQVTVAPDNPQPAAAVVGDPDAVPLPKG